jgi:hypothetical protein
VRSLSLTPVLVLILFSLAISFVASAAIIEAGLALSTSSTCHAVIVICLAFYAGTKVAMYVEPISEALMEL